MKPSSETRAQLEALRIPKAQRPDAPASAGASRRWGRLVLVAAMAAVAIGAYAARHRIGSALSGSPAQAAVRLVTVSVRQDTDPPPVLTATGKIVSDHKVQVVTKVSGQIVALFFEQGDRVAKDQLLARIEDVTYRARRDEAALEYGQKLLDYCEVMAPIAGVVLERNVEVGDVVAAEGGRGANANAQFASIADMSKLRVEVDISELDINRIRDVKSCTIVPDAYKDRRYKGHVLWIDPGADYSKATVQVKARIKDPDDRLRVEGSAQVTFLPEVETAAAATQTGPILWIPASACLPDPSGQTATVFVALDGRLRRSTVSIGRRVGGQVEVTQGLREGQSIAADGLANLADGQRLPS